MDRFKRTANIIKAYYSYKRTFDAATFVKEVCGFFDFIKSEPITEADMNLLLFLANEAGIPQYFDLFKDKFTDCTISEENIKAVTIGALLHDASLISRSGKLHRYQKNVVDSFKINKINRFVLTAPTSFGKTYLVYEIIHKMAYRNVLLIFPAISLLSENYARLCGSNEFNDYFIHSLSEEEFDLKQKNIFIFTPERFLSFMDIHHQLHFDFAFIDEVYKIDNSFIIDQETSGENERDTAYRLALEYICGLTSDMLLAGPYMVLPQADALEKKSFNDFAKDNGFSFLQYNHFEIVAKEFTTIKNRRVYDIDNISVEIDGTSKHQKIANIIDSLSTPTENTIVYCGRRSDTELYAKHLLQNQSLIASFQNRCSEIENDIYEIFLEHIRNTFGEDWIVLKALQGRIGIHHSLIPKYIQKEIVNLFNKGALLCLFSTTTITEGVNTSAKNIIITSNKKGKKTLRQFDAKNIAGRAGRFYHHYSGRVIDLDNHFEEIVTGQPEIIEHKNYDVDASKTDVDYQITKDQYLSEAERHEKETIQLQIAESKIPAEVFNCFRVVGPKDKLKLYHLISNLPDATINLIKQVPLLLAQSHARRLHWDGFQQIIELMLPIIHEDKLRNLIMIRTKPQERYSVVTVLLNSYLEGGFLAMVKFYTSRPKNPKTKDEAVRQVADFVYNVFKYHLVKYLGLFDVFFRYHVSKSEGIDMEDVLGLGLLLQKLEYNALSPTARKVSDYGVPFKLIDCYDSDSPYNKQNFDAYESHVDQEISRLLQ